METRDPDAPHTVGAAARHLGVSVRTLHHWDALGVASPSGRTPGGYREYLPADLARLRRVLVLRDLGVPLARIPSLLTANSVDRREELTRRRRDLDRTIARLQDVAATVDRLLAADERGVLLPDADRDAVFGAEWDPSWSAQARQRWGDSAQWAEYTERAADRTAEDWRRVVDATRAVTEALAVAKREGTTPGDARANALAERHRAAMSEYFHCTPSMHVLIARMYVTEPGFAEVHDRIEPGLAAWTRRVVDANARTHGVDPDTAVWE